jgi:hypothetical protein
MEPLVRASLTLRTMIRRGHGTLGAAALAVFAVLGGARTDCGPALAGAGAVWAVLLGSRVHAKAHETGDAPLLRDFEIGALTATALEAGLVRFDGGLAGRMSPLLYVLVAFVAAFARPAASILAVVWIVGLEAAYHVVSAPLGGPAGRGVTAAVEHGDWHIGVSALGLHAAFYGAFALVNLALLRAEVARVRSTARARVEAQLTRLKEDARSYRLLGAGEPSDRSEARHDRLARASVEEIHQSVHYALDLLRRSLDLHTAVLLWLNDAGTHVRISEISTSSDDVHDAPIRAGDGVLGAVLSRRSLVSLHGLKATFKVPYYKTPCPIRALLAIPVLDAETLRGVLVVDRMDSVAFTPHEEEITAQAARFCLRAIQNERVFLQLERAKVEQGKLYRAAQSLAAALSEKDVVEAGVKAAREIASFDVAAVTVYDDTTRSHEVVAAKSSGGNRRPGRHPVCAQRRPGFDGGAKPVSTAVSRRARRSAEGRSQQARPVAVSPQSARLAADPPRPRARDADPRGEPAARVRRLRPPDTRGPGEPSRGEPLQCTDGAQARDDGDHRRDDGAAQQACDARRSGPEDRRRHAIPSPSLGLGRGHRSLQEGQRRARPRRR